MTIKEFKKIVNKFRNMPSEDDLFLIVDADNVQDFERWLSVYTDTACWKKANLLLYAFNYSKECLDKAQKAQEQSGIYGYLYIQFTNLQ